MTPIPSAVAIGVAIPATLFAASSSDVTAMIVAGAALVTAIGTSFVNILSAKEAKRERHEVKLKVEENTAITQDVRTKADVIEGHVNSAATRDAAMIASLELQLALVRETLLKHEQTAALLAQATAVRIPKDAAQEVRIVNEPTDKVPVIQ